MAVLGAMSIAMRENLMSLFIVKSIAEVFCALVFLSHCGGVGEATQGGCCITITRQPRWEGCEVPSK